jgi:2-hydroxy-3-keto-5-methylthiopentenyl-1-phosphate phosphatase
MERNYKNIRRIGNIPRLDNCTVFFDFDNTISTFDVFDDMLANFAKDVTGWRELENKWEKGEIGSRECLEGQLKTIKIPQERLNSYLSEVKLDPYFNKLVKLLKKNKSKVIILSDNFDYILKYILKFKGFGNLEVYSNGLRFSEGMLEPIFPFVHKNCKVCAHCKTKNLLAKSTENSIIFYIGDGRSDICPSRYSDIVFAKDGLLDYYKRNKLPCLSYNNLKDVYKYFKRSFA